MQSDSNKNRHIQVGLEGEKISFDFLSSLGYLILETNWRYLKGEIDIICQSNDVIVIVEVKTRTTSKFGNPEEAVSESKQKLLMATAEAYLEEKDIDNELRFDVVSIILTPELTINHIIDAFGA